jgi:hypothetical protein
MLTTNAGREFSDKGFSNFMADKIGAAHDERTDWATQATPADPTVASGSLKNADENRQRNACCVCSIVAIIAEALDNGSGLAEDEVDAAIQSLTSIVEPLMMILVGLMVGVIVIAMYLPMFKMLSLVK